MGCVMTLADAMHSLATALDAADEREEAQKLEIENLKLQIAMWTDEGLPKGWDAGTADTSTSGRCSCCPDTKDGSATRQYGDHVNPAESARGVDRHGAKLAPLKRRLHGYIVSEGGWILRHSAGLYEQTLIASGSGSVREAFAACDAAAAAYIATLPVSQ